VEQLAEFAAMLAAENDHQNLIAARSLDAMWQRHIADSAQLLRFVPRETSTWLDVGTGAGFPGLVIAILREDCAVTLVESRQKRIGWLFQVCDKLGLANTTVDGERIERVQTKPYDVISARAFAPLDKLLRLSARFSTSETLWLLPKGRSAQQELHMLSGWHHTFHVEQSLTDDDAGIIVGQLLGRKGHRA
jgi:16S rRNA (guanine527-N7)-methyltransferase